MKIPGELQQITILVAKNGFISTLKQMPHLLMPVIEVLSVAAAQPLHDP
jgi:hypothetical protein